MVVDVESGHRLWVYSEDRANSWIECGYEKRKSIEGVSKDLTLSSRRDGLPSAEMEHNGGGAGRGMVIRLWFWILHFHPPGDPEQVVLRRGSGVQRR